MRIPLLTVFCLSISLIHANKYDINRKTEVIIDGNIQMVEPSIIQQIQSGGFNVWINTDGKKKKTTGIAYPLPLIEGTNHPFKPENQDAMQTIAKRPAPSNTKEAKPLMIQNELSMIGFLENNGLQQTKDSPVLTAFEQDHSGCLVYELAIPLKLIPINHKKSKSSDQKMYIGFIVNKVESGQREQRPEMGGGPGMGGGSDMSFSNSTTQSERKYWFKINLPDIH
ncbi:MAG: hypothetical protein AB7D40_08110 [Bacteroidales bacterium]